MLHPVESARQGSWKWPKGQEHVGRGLSPAYSESGDSSEMLWDVAEHGVEGPSAEAVAEGVAVV